MTAGPARSAAATTALLLALAGCTPSRHTLAPYRDDPGAAVAVEEDAAARCRAHAHPLPPAAFTTDGCSLFPDGTWGACCVEHDQAYWCGGSCAERFAADRALDACVAALGHAALGTGMLFGVRLGGGAWLPAPWRWGYGWPWPHGYDDAPAPLPDDRAP